MNALVAIAFWTLVLSGSAIVALSKDRSAQRFLGAILAATGCTTAADMMIPAALTIYAYLAIDGLLLAVALFYVVRIDNYWPI